ncbi:hypothetical protein M422DRAFT_142016, partial [Sphaerobolus stellatus SS14]
LLCWKLGGPKLVYALNHSMGLPSLTAIRRHANRHNVIPSVGIPRSSDIQQNIAAFWGDKPPRGKCGHSVLIDEINLEERGQYLPGADSILGLCREHCSAVDSRVLSIEAVEEVSEVLKQGKCHLGKEATVCAIGAFGYDDYEAYPVIISPMCKTEVAEGSVEWLSLVILIWKDSPNAQAKNGPIWSFASDGDATRRKAFHSIFLGQKLPHSAPLWDELGHLSLMNLWTGEDYITMDFD